MRLLAIDTALVKCSAAVLDDSDGVDRLVVSSEEIGRGHAERLMDMIAEALAEAELGFADLDRLVVTVGPGSFTGVRVGLATARGLGLVVKKPVVGVTTLAALAEEARGHDGDRPLAAVLDAKRGEVYGQLFDGTDPLGPPVAESVVAFAARLPGTVALIGSGAPAVAAAAPSGCDVSIVAEPAAPDIAAVARLGRQAPQPAASPSPLYLRAPDAKPQVASRIARV